MEHSLRVSRRSHAFLHAASGDYLLREQLATDPANMLYEYAHGESLTPETGAAANHLLQAMLSSPGMLAWLKRAAIAKNAKSMSNADLAQHLTNALQKNPDRAVLSALMHFGAVPEARIEPAFDLVRSLIDALRSNGRFGGGVSATEFTPATEFSPGTGTNFSPGTGTNFTPGTGTNFTPSGTQFTPGTGGTEFTPGTGTGGTEMTPGTGTGGTEMTPGTGTGGTEMTPGTGTGGTEMTPGTGTGGTEMTPGTGTGGTEMTPGTGTGGTEMTPGTGTGGTEMTPGTGTGTESSPGTGTESTPGTGTESTPGTGTEASLGAVFGRDFGQLQVTLQSMINFAVQLRRSGALFDVGLGH
jgi:hypothetical protein